MPEKFKDFRRFVDGCFTGPFCGTHGVPPYEWQPTTQEAVAKLRVPFHVALTNYQAHNLWPSPGVQHAVEVYVKNPCKDGPRHYLAHREVVHRPGIGEGLLRDLQNIRGYEPIPPFVDGQETDSHYLLIAAQQLLGPTAVHLRTENGCVLNLRVYEPDSNPRTWVQYTYFFLPGTPWFENRRVYTALRNLPSNIPWHDAP